MTNGTITIASFAQHDDPPETIATDAAQPSEVDARFRHMDSAQIVEEVQKHYTTFAKSHNAKYSKSVAKSFGYSEEALAAVSQDANLGLSCGNPLAVASVREALCAGRNRHRPGQWCRLRRFPGRSQSRPKREGHRRRHEPGYACSCQQNQEFDQCSECLVCRIGYHRNRRPIGYRGLHHFKLRHQPCAQGRQTPRFQRNVPPSPARRPCCHL
ncbi:hypothetical protein B0J12DRAFT_316227 [Macrophomina phaseolina]|uniref:Uncharacterized protein n=1 Tax=Macrophomina phaseolina TaxID=35725 RepID=A0ABQ8FWK7_9PEZI|nr:hypothetical protein B0J12DRAFT_316227 [Macrophomina phaseolina]